MNEVMRLYRLLVLNFMIMPNLWAGIIPDQCKSVNTHDLKTVIKTAKSHTIPILSPKSLHVNNAHNNYGIRYKNLYMGTQLNFPDTRYLLQSKSSLFNTHEGAHLANGGLRFGHFVNNKTLLYFKAGVAHHNNLLGIGKTKFKPGLKNNRSTFMPSMGIEWNIEDKCALRGEVGVKMNDITSANLSSNQHSGIISIDFKYKLGS